MKRSRFTQEQVIGMLKENQADASASDLCRKHGISDAPARWSVLPRRLTNTHLCVPTMPTMPTCGSGCGCWPQSNGGLATGACTYWGPLKHR